jgi:hypothetical protein
VFTDEYITEFSLFSNYTVKAIAVSLLVQEDVPISEITAVYYKTALKRSPNNSVGEFVGNIITCMQE